MLHLEECRPQYGDRRLKNGDWKPEAGDRERKIEEKE
jgi:hypothetical protein